MLALQTSSQTIVFWAGTGHGESEELPAGQKRKADRSQLSGHHHF